MAKIQTWENIKSSYPNQWVLLGNPEINDDRILGGIVIFHHLDKKAVLSSAQKEIDNYNMVKVAFTGESSKAVRLNIFKVSETP